MKNQGLDSALRQLGEDMRDLWQPICDVPREDARTLTPLRFYRDYVAKSMPVILEHVLESDQWLHAREHWKDDEYIIGRVGEQSQVSVNVTPFGEGDAILELSESKQLFVLPEERAMTMREFYTALKSRNDFDGVPYLSHQNDSLRTEFPDLYAQIPISLPLAQEAFGNNAEAVNLWIGDERAVSTMHKDHFENMYCVVVGKKHFTLLPPPAIAFLYEEEHAVGCFSHSASSGILDEEANRLFHEKYPEYTSWSITKEEEGENKTPWVAVDPLRIDTEKFPRANELCPIECVVEEGEVLYLPALWYHRATQLEKTISVNYWHDMDFDCRYVYYNFIHEISSTLGASA